MMKRLMICLFVCIVTSFGLYAVDNDDTSLNKLSGEALIKANGKIAVLVGSTQEMFVTDSLKNAQILQFDKLPDALLMLTSNKVDYIVVDKMIAREVLKTDSTYEMISGLFCSGNQGAAFGKTDKGKQLCDKFNKFLAKIKGDGTYDAMCNRWFCSTQSVEMPHLDLPTEGTHLKCGAVGDLKPYAFIHNGHLAGFEIELIKRFSMEIGTPIVLEKYSTGALSAALSSAKVDMICGCINITSERAKQVLFSDPYTQSSSVAITKSNSTGDVHVEKSFQENLTDSFYSNILSENRYEMLCKGLLITVLIAFFSLVFGTILGGVICYMVMSKNHVMHIAGETFIAVMHGVPVLVLLMILFYVIFAQSSLSGITISIITFSLNFSAYVAEMFHSGIENIDKGQSRAGVAMGFTKTQAFRLIVAPQALRCILPIYKSEIISLLKMTSIVGYVAVLDLTKASDIIRSYTFDAFFPLFLTAVMYFLLARGLGLLVDYLMKKI